MKTLLTLAALGAVASSFAGTYYYSGSLTSTSPTFANPYGSTSGTAVEYFSALSFTVSVSGAYVFETASPNAAGTPSSALDTSLLLYAGTFTAATTPSSYLLGNDDFSGTFTVLPGPYTNVSATATGYTGAEPGSRLASTTVLLTAGTVYSLVNSSFRNTDYVVTATEGGAKGAFYTGISGAGSISPVPEPATFAVLGLGAVAMLRRRKRA